MSSKAICIRETLYSAIRSVSAVSWLFARSPGRDFTRNVKLPFAKLITLILSLKGSSITCECQRQFEIVRKRRRNFVVFRRGGNKTKRFLAQKECSQFAASGA